MFSYLCVCINTGKCFSCLQKIKIIFGCKSKTSAITLFNSSHPEVLYEKGVLKIFSKFTGEQPCRSVISIKSLCNFIEITLLRGCSPVNLLHIFRTPSDGCFLLFLFNILSLQIYVGKWYLTWISITRQYCITVCGWPCVTYIFCCHVNIHYCLTLDVMHLDKN